MNFAAQPCQPVLVRIMKLTIVKVLVCTTQVSLAQISDSVAVSTEEVGASLQDSDTGTTDKECVQLIDSTSYEPNSQVADQPYHN